MKLLGILLCIVFLVTLIPYIRIFCKRLSLRRRLKSACTKNGWTLSPAHRFWYFGTKQDERCDVHIVTRHDVYSVKLFAVPRRSSTLVFTGGSGYFIRYYLALIGIMGSAAFPLDGRNRLLPKYRFREQFDASWDTKKQHKILLLSPTPFEIMRIPKEGKQQILGAGDLVLDMNVYSLSRLLGRIEQLDDHMNGVRTFENLSV